MKRRTMVLVHGAWQGSWSWDAWMPELRQRGWHAVAVDLPGNGCDPRDTTRAEAVSLGLYAAHVADILRALGEPAVLVGHSGGGITVSQVADMMPEAVSAVVYIAGMMLPHETTFAQLSRQYREEHPDDPLPGIGPELLWNDARTSSTVPSTAARRIFLHDCEATLAAAAVAKLRPQPEGGRDMAPRFRGGAYGATPRIYVEALQDRSISLALQRRMQALSPGARRLCLDCGHVPQLVQPRRLAELLLPVLERELAESSIVHPLTGKHL